MNEFTTVIGLEVHVQLATASKLFCGCSTRFGAPPNTQTCPVCLGLPGSLPVMNEAAYRLALKTAVALNCKIPVFTKWDRKQYYYPDLPKGYQISQYETPIVQGGRIRFYSDDVERVIRLTRAHLEEDAGKSLHEDFHGMTGIDLNRAGTPLLEIVSEPELRGAKEAVIYARTLHALVVWIGVCDGNMQEGSFRCDANVSVRRRGDAALGTRCEIKNLNSFRFMERAIEFEAQRQIALLEDGGEVEQETRLYDPQRDETRSMRAKEHAQDYRYFPDPDLPPLLVPELLLNEIRRGLPELPDVRRERFVREYALSVYDARLLTASRAAADYFEALVTASGVDPKLCANWQTGELSAVLNREERDIAASPVSPQMLAGILQRISDGTISGKAAKQVFEVMWKLGGGADEIVERHGLRQVSDAGAIDKLVDEVLAANARLVADYRTGKEKAFNALVGQVMKASKGKANPVQASEALRSKLG